MTRVDKSPEQLSAEAAAPARNLADAITLHRALAAAELFLPRLHEFSKGRMIGEPQGADLEEKVAKHRAKPSGDPLRCAICSKPVREEDGRYRHGGVNGQWSQVTGVPFAHPFQRFLDGSFGAQFPWSAGVKSLRNDCRRSHSEHWAREEWRGSLCNRLVHLVIREAWSFERACQELVVTPERTERTLLRAFRRIEERLAEIQSRETEAVKSSEGRHDWMAPEHVHHAVPGAHMAECPQCIRGAVA